MPFQPDFHDGFVDGVLASDGTARIVLRIVTGERFTLLLRGVDALRVNDFRKGNIVLELNAINLDHIDPEFVFEIYDYSEESKKAFVLTDWVEAAKKKGLKAIEIIPSCGCAIAALAEDYELVQGISLA